MSKPWEADDDFVMYLNSGDRGTHPLEPDVTTVHSAFRQELEIPFMDSPVPLMHHDPDRSWITDPDPDHPKGTQL